MKYIQGISIVVALVLFISGCAGGISGGISGGNPRLPYSHDEVVQQTLGEFTFTESEDEFQRLVTNIGTAPRTYQIPVNSSGNSIWRLYFSVANTSGIRTAVPKISVLQAPPGMRSGRAISVSSAPTGIDPQLSPAPLGSDTVPRHRFPTVERLHLPVPIESLLDPEDNFSPMKKITGAQNAQPQHSQSSTSLSPAVPPDDVLNNRATFNIISDGSDKRTQITATARVVRMVGSQKVVFWTPDSVYTGCTTGCLPSDGLLTNADIDIMADAFLKTGDKNDIYDLMQSIFGTHWGSHRFDDRLIPANYDNQIDFLLYNIGNRAGNSVYGGGTLGYFWSGNNFLKSSQSKSNARLLLAIHAPWFKVSRRYLGSLGYNVAVQDTEFERYRHHVLITLVHEYQHLINFYQRLILDGSGAEPDSAWLNEQFSLMSEDLLYYRLFGPSSTNVFGSMNINATDNRGLNGLGAGSYSICDGRIPDYLFGFGSRGISQWQDKLWNYGVNFSFGAYLTRNYGGVNFVRSAYETRSKNAAALTHALNAHTSGLNIGEAVRRWGATVLLSDQTGAPNAYKTNNGDSGFTSTYNGITYRLGSINYYNYASSCARNAGGGLRIFNTTESAYNTLNNTQDGHSAIPIAVAENLLGTAQFKVTLSPGQSLTAVAKRDKTTNNPVFY